MVDNKPPKMRVKGRIPDFLGSHELTAGTKISAVEIYSNQLRIQLVKKPRVSLMCKFEQPEEAAEYLRRIIRKHNDTLRMISIDQEGFPVETMNFSELKDLKAITFNTNRGISTHFAFTNFRQFYKVSENVTLVNISINVDQLLRFEASKIVLDEVRMSSKDLSVYLKIFEIGHFQDKTEKLKIFMDRNCLLDPEQVMEKRNCVGKQEECGHTSFTLLSTKSPKIAVIKLTRSYFKMRIYSRPQLENKEVLETRFGSAIEEEYLRREFVFLDMGV